MGMTNKQFDEFLEIVIEKQKTAIKKAIDDNSSEEVIAELQSMKELLENAMKD